MICGICGSKHPHLHPAVQFEGEVELCTDEFHTQETPQNLPIYIAAVLAKRASIPMVFAASILRARPGSAGR